MGEDSLVSGLDVSFAYFPSTFKLPLDFSEPATGRTFISPKQARFSIDSDPTLLAKIEAGQVETYSGDGFGGTNEGTALFYWYTAPDPTDDSIIFISSGQNVLGEPVPPTDAQYATVILEPYTSPNATPSGVAVPTTGVIGFLCVWINGAWRKIPVFQDS